MAILDRIKREVKVIYRDPTPQDPDRIRSLRGVLVSQDETGVTIKRQTGEYIFNWSSVLRIEPARGDNHDK